MGKIKIENIPFNKYFLSPKKDEYDRLMKFGIIEAIDIFMIGNLMEYNFGQVKDVQFAVNSGMTWQIFVDEISSLIGIHKEVIGSTPIFSMHQARLHLINEVSKINQLEGDNLGHMPSSDELNADIDRFNIFKTFPQFDTLTSGDLLKIEGIRSQPYMLCFTKLHYEATKIAYRDDLNLILKSKNRTS